PLSSCAPPHFSGALVFVVLKQPRRPVRASGCPDGRCGFAAFAALFPNRFMDKAPSKKGSASRKEATGAPETKRKPVRTLRIEDCSASIWARDALVQGAPKRFY